MFVMSLFEIDIPSAVVYGFPEVLELDHVYQGSRRGGQNRMIKNPILVYDVLFNSNDAHT